MVSDMVRLVFFPLWIIIEKIINVNIATMTNTAGFPMTIIEIMKIVNIPPTHKSPLSG